MAKDSRSRRRALWCMALGTAVATAFLVLPALTGVPARLVEACGRWIATAGVLEVLTNAPGMIVLGTLGTLLWLGLPGGPQQIGLTLLPAVLAFGLLLATWFSAHSSGHRPPRWGGPPPGFWRQPGR
jgi:hypothetical protein